MLCIVFSHYAVHSSFNFDIGTISLNRLWTQITVLGNVGVNLFILISGYFMSYSKKPFKLEKLIKICGQVLFYSIGTYLLLVFIHKETFSIFSLVKNIIPIITEQYWFATTYVILMILSPYLNMFIESLKQKQHIKLICILMICWVIIPTLTNYKLKCNDLLWFAYLYIISAYIRKYNNQFKKSSNCYIFVACALFLLYIVSVLVIDLAGIRYPSLASKSIYFCGKQNIIMVLLCISLFIGFIKKDINYNFINIISAGTFGVYLIHEHPSMRNILWNDIMSFSIDIKDSIIFIPVSILICFGVYIVCTIIELVRRYFSENYTDKFLVKYIDQIVNKLNKFYTVVFERLK